MIEIAQANAGEPVGFDAISWVFDNRASGDAKETALEFLLAHYLEEPRLAPLLDTIAQDPTKAAGDFLRAVMNSTKREVKGAAHFSYANHLMNISSLLNFLEAATAEERKGLVSFLGSEEAAAEFEKVDRDELAAKAEKLLEQVVAEFGDLNTSRSQKMGVVAGSSLFELKNLSIGKVAPEIKGEDIDGNVFALSEYRGKVIFLDFWGDW